MRNVYHPGFKGSFSIKAVLNPLVPDLTYNDPVIVPLDGLCTSGRPLAREAPDAKELRHAGYRSI